MPRGRRIDVRIQFVFNPTQTLLELDDAFTQTSSDLGQLLAEQQQGNNPEEHHFPWPNAKRQHCGSPFLDILNFSFDLVDRIRPTTATVAVFKVR
jgi:hypothetical protein